jgi:hypothetical protein
MKFFTALRSAEYAAKISAAAGFDLEAALKAGNENALKDFIAAAVTDAVAKAGVPSADLTAENASLNASLKEAVEENKTITGSLSAAGFTFPETPATATATERIENNRAAFDAHVKLRAQGLLAQTGHPAVAETLNTSGAKTMARKAFSALTPGAQMEFIKAGGMLVE